MKLYLGYKEYTFGGEVCAGDEDNDWPNYEDANIDWHLTDCNIIRDTENWYQEEVDVDFDVKIGKSVYVVYVRYGTGNTFGHVNGAWTIIGVYKTQETADKVKKSIEDDTYERYKCWTGYFESFESCEVEKFIIE